MFVPVLKTSAAIASWYGEDHRGKLTASGAPFDPDLYTAASWHYPFGTKLKVSHGSRSVLVTVNDRGPAKRLKRDIDLSMAAFRGLALLRRGLLVVKIERVK